MNTPLEPNSDITIIPSTAGSEAVMKLEKLEEYSSATITFQVNNHLITCPRFFEVNGSLEPPYYEIQEGDRIETRGFYTVAQVMEFMDVEIDRDREIYVNNRVADLETLVYENFSIEWTVLAYRTPESEARANLAPGAVRQAAAVHAEEEAGEGAGDGTASTASQTEEASEGAAQGEDGQEQAVSDAPQGEPAERAAGKSITVQINGEPVELSGKDSYIFVDVFNFIDFDLDDSQGRQIVTRLNGASPSYTQEIRDGDIIEIYWRE
jgi:uncharacterized protein YdeI (BOF family)